MLVFLGSGTKPNYVGNVWVHPTLMFYVYFFVCVCVYPTVFYSHAWRSENHLGKSVLFFHVSLGTSAYVVGLGGKSLDPWSPPPPQPMTNLLTLRNNVTNIQSSQLTESPKKNWKTIHIVLSESGFCCWLQFIHGYPSYV